MTEDKLLLVQNLTTAYRNKIITNDVSFDLAGGEAICILGANGEGKTTLLKTILGILPKKAGQICYGNKDISTLTIAERAKCVSYVPQNSAGNFTFTVLEMVLMGKASQISLFSKPTKAMRESALAILEKLEIGDLAHKYYPLISGGQRQMVLIARALVQNAGLIILDEPTASLDFSNQDKLMRLLANLKKAGQSIIFTTHHPDQAFYFSDRSLLIKHGCVMDYGDTGRVVDETNLSRLYNADIAIADIRGKKITYIRD